ncbi:hypothetical protein BC829DRAFT_488036 [Chytridium lagenaria]|nr:hypothetical protein BC829DRAFT_488036 [Chytridium lagenaria]
MVAPSTTNPAALTTDTSSITSSTPSIDSDPETPLRTHPTLATQTFLSIGGSLSSLHHHTHTHQDAVVVAVSEQQKSKKDKKKSKEDIEADANLRKLGIATVLCLAFFLVELGAGLWSGSLAILSDSFHLLSDIAGFGISIAALYVARQPPTSRHSFGFARVEILGAVLSTFLIWVLTAYLVYEAVQRIRNPSPIDGVVMCATAVVGVLVNLVLGATLHGEHGHHGHSHSHGGHDHGHSHSHGGHSHSHGHQHGHSHDNHSHSHGHSHSHDHTTNEQSTLLPKPPRKPPTSMSILISSIVILIWPNMTIVDPICTLRVLMEATPSDIDPPSIRHALLTEIPHVVDVHDLHVWTLTQGKAILTAHIVFRVPTAEICESVGGSPLLEVGDVGCGGCSEEEEPTMIMITITLMTTITTTTMLTTTLTLPTPTAALPHTPAPLSPTLKKHVRLLRCGDLHRRVLRKAQEIVRRVGVHHATFQIEPLEAGKEAKGKMRVVEEVEEVDGVKEEEEEECCGLPEMCKGLN